ncbi:hypothetical protein [Glutamicibacter nicotianae]|uniref:hypothetical protein n=1 Tax=Glutamicibacter nicotianae TaxID=37929 RepID=UPI001958D45C|nr:hypothetical protein [Glutamicibacter nicotianae]MBM7767342.1 hypothetical protein [Glutamicibacter nicotianae]
MGANEKHAATYHGGEYTPDADGLRDLWVDSKLDHLPRAAGIPLVPTVQAEFNRWLETVRSEAKAEALEEAINALMAGPEANLNPDGTMRPPHLHRSPILKRNPRLRVANWLLRQANQYKEEQ